MIIDVPGDSPTVLRALNRNHLLRIVRHQGPTTRKRIAEASGLSKPTVNEVVADLVDAGLLFERQANDDEVPRRPGPRPRVVAFRRDRGCVLGVDIGTTKSRVFLADLGGVTQARHRIEMPTRPTKGNILDVIRSGIDTALAQAHVSFADVLATAVGTPGIVDPVTRRVTLAPQLQGWEGIALADELDYRLACPVVVANEVHLAMLGERWLGAARGISEAVYLHVGIGIGLGFLKGGMIHRGVNGAAGEIGYLPTASVTGVTDGTGRFEYAAAGPAYERRGREAARRPDGKVLLDLAGGDPDVVTAELVFEAARRGSEAAFRIIEELTGILAEGTAVLCLILNPDTVIVGGGVSRAGPLLIEPLARHTRKLVPFPPRFTVSELGDDVVAFGAVRQALDMADEQIYTGGMGSSGRRL